MSSEAGKKKRPIPEMKRFKPTVLKIKEIEERDLMTRRLFLVTLLMITVFILALSGFTDDGSERSTIAQRSLKDQEVEESAVNAPVSFSEALFRISSEYGIPPKLVLAIIQVESQGNPKATSPAGALGLMQLMPEVIKACEVVDPFDPLTNILAGVRHLNYLLLEFSGNLSLALAAYNAGPGTVRRYGGIPPFPETWNFVNSVLREYQGVGNELEMFLQALEVQIRLIQNIHEKNSDLVRGSKELFTFIHQEIDPRTLQVQGEKEYDFKK